MSADKDMESIKSGAGLSKSSTSNAEKQSTGTKDEQRAEEPGIRKDVFTRQDSSKKGDQ